MNALLLVAGMALGMLLFLLVLRTWDTMRAGLVLEILRRTIVDAPTVEDAERRRGELVAVLDRWYYERLGNVPPTEKSP